MLFDLQNSPSDYLEYRFDGQTGATPLHVAAANGYLSVVEYLVCADAMFWSVMHTKRGAIFWSPLGRENFVSDFGVHIILYARFHHPLHL